MDKIYNIRQMSESRAIPLCKKWFSFVLMQRGGLKDEGGGGGEKSNFTYCKGRDNCCFVGWEGRDLHVCLCVCPHA